MKWFLSKTTVRRGAMSVLLAVACVVCASAVTSAAVAKPKPKRGPINAKVTVDAGGSKSAQITEAAGGTIVVTAKNGTKITVSFPAGAVQQDTLVKATPVTKLASPVTRVGLLGGVQLEPEGLKLLRSATVRFTRSRKAPAKTTLVFVGSEGDGRDLYRVPPPTRNKGHKLVLTGQPVVSINHFSTVEGFDWSAVTVHDLDAILYPAIGEHRLSQEISKLLADHNAGDVLDALYRARTWLIMPLLESASLRLTNSCSEASVRYAQTTFVTALGLERQVQLLGGDSDFNPAAAAEVIKKVAACLTNLCPKLGDPRVGPYFLSLAHELAVLGYGNEGADPVFAALFENMKRCGAYEVRIDSRIDVSQDAGYNFSYRVAGKAKVIPDAFDGTGLPPSGPLDYVSVSGSHAYGCWTETVTSSKSGAFQVIEPRLSAYDPAHAAKDPVLSLTIIPNVAPTETYTTRAAAPCVPPEKFDASVWLTGFGVQHPEFTFAGADFYRADPPVFARAVYQKAVGFPVVGENTLVEIVHTPQDPVPIP